MGRLLYVVAFNLPMSCFRSGNFTRSRQGQSGDAGVKEEQSSMIKGKSSLFIIRSRLFRFCLFYFILFFDPAGVKMFFLRFVND